MGCGAAADMNVTGSDSVCVTATGCVCAPGAGVRKGTEFGAVCVAGAGGGGEGDGCVSVGEGWRGGCVCVREANTC